MSGHASVFTPDQFVATQWETAERKAQFAHEFMRFVESGFEKALFTQEFYRRLSNTFGHIAHYNRTGFYEEFFTTAKDKVRFLQQALDYPCYGDPTFTYSDVERALQGWLHENEIVGKYQAQVLFPSNQVRAERFAALLPHYAEDDRTNSINVLADCIHWCDREGMDFERLLTVARRRSEAEHDEERGQVPPVEGNSQTPPRQEEQDEATTRKDESRKTQQSSSSTGESRQTEPNMTGNSKGQEICHIESGPFTAIVRGQYNPRSETWTYRAAIYWGNNELLEPMLKHEVAGVLHISQERGGPWLAAIQLSRGLPQPQAGNEELQNLENALKASEVLIGRFAERGHQAILHDQSINDELELRAVAQQSQTPMARIPTRDR